MRFRLHSDKRGISISNRLNDDFEQCILSVRARSIWTRKGKIGKVVTSKREKKKTEARVLAQVLQQTGPWEEVTRES